MKTCLDPLQAVRRVGSSQPWCVNVPAQYPTNIHYLPTNIEFVDQKPNTFTNDRENIIDSPLCANSRLLQNIRQKVDLFQTPTSNDAQRILQRLTNSVRKHVPDFVFHETTDAGVDQNSPKPSNLHQAIPPTPGSGVSVSNIPSLSQPVHDLITTNSSDDNPLIITSASDASPVSSAIDLKSSGFLSPSRSQPGIGVMSAKRTSSTVQSPRIMMNDLKQQSPLVRLPRLNHRQRSSSRMTLHNNQEQRTSMKSGTNQYHNNEDNQHRSPVMVTDGEPCVRHNWIKKLVEKVSNKRLNAIKRDLYGTTAPEASHRGIHDRNMIGTGRLHIAEAMAAFESNLSKEAFQTLINKAKDAKQNGFMHMLTAPARCCRSCRTQRRLASIALRSLDIATKGVKIPQLYDEIYLSNYRNINHAPISTDRIANISSPNVLETIPTQHHSNSNQCTNRFLHADHLLDRYINKNYHHNEQSSQIPLTDSFKKWRRKKNKIKLDFVC